MFCLRFVFFCFYYGRCQKRDYFESSSRSAWYPEWIQLNTQEELFVYCILKRSNKTIFKFYLKFIVLFFFLTNLEGLKLFAAIWSSQDYKQEFVLIIEMVSKLMASLAFFSVDLIISCLREAEDWLPSFDWLKHMTSVHGRAVTLSNTGNEAVQQTPWRHVMCTGNVTDNKRCVFTQMQLMSDCSRVFLWLIDEFEALETTSKADSLLAFSCCFHTCCCAFHLFFTSNLIGWFHGLSKIDWFYYHLDAGKILLRDFVDGLSVFPWSIENPMQINRHFVVLSDFSWLICLLISWLHIVETRRGRFYFRLDRKV